MWVKVDCTSVFPVRKFYLRGLYQIPSNFRIQNMIRLSFGFCALRLCKKSAGQPGLPPFPPQSVSSLACSAKSVCSLPARSPTRPPWPRPCPPLLSGKKSNCREIDAANCAICVREAFELEERNCAFLCHNSDSFNTHYEGMIKCVFLFIINGTY